MTTVFVSSVWLQCWCQMQKAQCLWSIHAIRLLEVETYQYAHKSSLGKIPTGRVHEVVCLSNARSCYCRCNIHSYVNLRLLCFALQVLAKPHTQHNTTQHNTTQHNTTQHKTHTHTRTHTHTHTHTAIGTDVVMLRCVDTESRLAEECVCMCVMTLGFFASRRFNVWSQMCSQDSSERTKIQ